MRKCLTCFLHNPIHFGCLVGGNNIFLEILLQLQYRGFQNCPATSLPSARFNEGDKLRKFSRISFRTTGMPVLVNSIQPKIIKLSVSRNFHSFPSLTHSSRFVAPVQSQLQIGFPKAVTPTYISIYGILDIGYRFSSPYYRALAKRPFSEVPRVKSKCENLGVRDGIAKNALPLDTFSIQRRQKKSSARRRSLIVGEHAAASNQPTKASSSSSRRSALGNDNKLTQEEQLVDDGRKDADLTYTAVLQSNSTGDKLVEVPDGSVSMEKKSNKATGSPNKKEKSPKVTKKSPKKQIAQSMGKINSLKLKPLKKLYPPSGKSVVVVESVTKAKVIQGYLGDMYEVLPSYGHVRDLAARSGSVRPDDDFSMVWEVPSAAWTHLKSIKVALSGYDIFFPFDHYQFI